MRLVTVLATVVALYNVAGLTSPALWGKGVNKWSSQIGNGDAVAVSRRGVEEGVVDGVSAETKVKRYYRWEGLVTSGAFFFIP